MPNECPKHSTWHWVLACAHRPNREVILVHEEKYAAYHVLAIKDVEMREAAFAEAARTGFVGVGAVLATQGYSCSSREDAERVFRERVDAMLHPASAPSEAT